MPPATSAQPRMHPRDSAGPPPTGRVPRAGRTLPLALKLTRKRLSGLVAVALAVAGGAAFITAGGVLAETGLRSHLPAERMPGAEVVVAAPQTLDQREDIDPALPERAQLPVGLVGQLDGLPGAGAAVGDIGFPAAVATGDGTASGPDPRTAGRGWSAATRLGGDVTGAAPQGPAQVALDAETARAAGAEVGDELRITAAGRTGQYDLTAVVSGSGAGIFFGDATATGLKARAGGGEEAGVDLIGLSTAGGTSDTELADAVRAEVAKSDTGAVVRTGDSRGDAEVPAGSAGNSTLLAIAGSLSGTVLIIVGFAVAGSVSISVAAQRRDLALLRIVGATPRRIRRLVAAPNLAATAAALPLGIAGGYLLAVRLHDLLAGLGIVPEQLPVSFSPLPALASLLLLPATVWLAALAASAPIAAAPPITALADAQVQVKPPRQGRAVAGAALMAGSLVLGATPLFIDSRMGMVGTATASMLAVIGLALAGPALVRGITGAIARRLPARTSTLTWLAVHNLHGHAYRVAGAVASLAMAVAFTLGYAYAQTTPVAAAAQQQSEGALAQYQVSAPGLGGVPEEAVAAVRDSPGVAAAVVNTPTSVVWSYRMFGNDFDTFEVLSAGALGTGAAQAIDPEVTAGGLDRLHGDTIALSASYARQREVGVGDTAEFRMGDGARVSAEVVALYERDLGFGQALVADDLASGHVTGGLPATLLVRAQPGQEAAAGEALDKVAAEHPGLRVDPAAGSQGASSGSAELPADAILNFVVLSALLGYMLMSVANRLAAQTLQRGGEVTSLRSIGMTPAQVRSLLRRESVMLAVGAIAAGIAAVAVPLVMAGIGFLGRPWPGGPVWLLPAAAGVVALLAWLSVEIPARRLVAAEAKRR